MRKGRGGKNLLQTLYTYRVADGIWLSGDAMMSCGPAVFRLRVQT